MPYKMDAKTNPKGIIDKPGVLHYHMHAPHAPYGMNKMHEAAERAQRKVLGIRLEK